MATYPSLKQTYESDRQRLTESSRDEGGDGSLWVRQMYPADKYVSTVAHVVNASEKARWRFYSVTRRCRSFVFRDNWPHVYQIASSSSRRSTN